MPLELDNLIVTHNALRNPSAINNILKNENVIELIKRKPIPIMKIQQIRFYKPYDMYFIRDGHHCLISYYHFKLISNLPLQIEDDGYTIEERTFSELWTPNPDVGWVTPFNPITHVRKPNFISYKKRIMELRQSEPTVDLYPLILSSTEEYSEIREVFTLKDLYLKHKEQITNEKNILGINAY